MAEELFPPPFDFEISAIDGDEAVIINVALLAILPNDLVKRAGLQVSEGK
jgi:hypothetical protein